MDKDYARKISGAWELITGDFEVPSDEIHEVVIDEELKAVRVTLRRTLDWVRNFATPEELEELQIAEVQAPEDVAPGMRIVGEPTVVDHDGAPRFKNKVEPIPLEDMRRMARGVIVERAAQEMAAFTYEDVLLNAETALTAVTNHLAQRRQILPEDAAATFKLTDEDLRSWTEAEAVAFATTAFSYAEGVNAKQAAAMAAIGAAASNDAVLAALAETD